MTRASVGAPGRSDRRAGGRAEAAPGDRSNPFNTLSLHHESNVMVARAKSKRSAGEGPGLHAVARIFPPMAEAEYEGFRQDIKRNGLRDPITTHEGKVVDGAHRLRACRELGIVPRFV